VAVPNSTAVTNTSPIIALAAIGEIGLPPPPQLATHLHQGEQEAIALALATPGAWVILDDGEARQIALALGLFVKGTLGILVEGRRRGFIAKVRPLIEELVRQGNYVSTDLIGRVLASVGE